MIIHLNEPDGSLLVIDTRNLVRDESVDSDGRYAYVGIVDRWINGQHSIARETILLEDRVAACVDAIQANDEAEESHREREASALRKMADDMEDRLGRPRMLRAQLAATPASIARVCGMENEVEDAQAVAPC